MKQINLKVENGKALQVDEVSYSAGSPIEVSADDQRFFDAFKAYRMTMRRLLESRLQDLKEQVPVHARTKCRIFALRCCDGLCVRYEASTDDLEHLLVTAVPESLKEIVPKFSDGFAYVADQPAEFEPPRNGMEIQVLKVSPNGEVESTLSLGAAVVFPLSLTEAERSSFSHRPLCVGSVCSELTVDLLGMTTRAAGTGPSEIHDEHNFVAHSTLRLPVAWHAIEVFSAQDFALWNPSEAPSWAELDVLAAATRANIRAESYRKLDSGADARQKYARVLAEFEALLDGLEEPAHQFLKRHPELLCPTAERSWSKLQFGDRVSDFVFREPFNDYLLVEIEAPVRQLLRQDGQQRQELTHAMKQVSDWVQYIEDHRVEVEKTHGLVGISVSPRRLIVIGRSVDLDGEGRRQLTTIQNAQPKLRILTYDDVVSQARATIERILGPIWLAGPSTTMHFYRR